MTEFEVNLRNDLEVEVYPPEALYLKNGERPELQSLRVEGGVVEIIDRQDLSPAQMVTAALVSLGVTDPDIAQVMSYDKKSIWSQNLEIFRKLDAKNRTHVPTRLLERRIARVISPIALPDLREPRPQILTALAEGKTAPEIHEELGYSFSSVKNHIAGILRDYDVRRAPRAVLLGHMGRRLPPGSTAYSGMIEAKRNDTPVSCIAKATFSGPSPTNSQIDYLEWDGGVVAFSARPALNTPEQRVLGLTAVGLSRLEVAAYLDTSVSTVTSRLKAINTKLDARNRPHAITMAEKTEEIKVIEKVEPIELSPIDVGALRLAANGLTSEQSECVLGMSAGTIRNINSETLVKLNARTISAAVMKAYMMSYDLNA